MNKKHSARIRLYTNSALSDSAYIELSKENAHYLANVMRKKSGDDILLFNGCDGEWLGTLDNISKKSGQVKVKQQTKSQQNSPDLLLCFALVKNAPSANIVQKATELGVGALQPMITKYTVAKRINIDKISSNVIEAAEQCRRLDVPKVLETSSLTDILNNWDEERTIILCDESGEGKPILEALSGKNINKAAIFIGPEGGFSADEFEMLRKKPYMISVGMGARILRADTAAIAAITCYQAVLGDWSFSPNF